MSKEFDKEVREYYERTYHVMIEGAEYAYEMGCNPQFPDPYSVQAAFAAGRALGRSEMKGEAILVPRIPEPSRVESMCVRYNHGFHLKKHVFLKDLGGYRDETDEEFERRKEATRTTMRQLYEEATGQGFYQPAAAIEAIPEEV